MEIVPLEVGRNVHGKGAPVREVYFPVSGTISLVQIAADDLTIETGIVGKEGLVGIDVILEAESAANEAVVQTSGEAFKISAASLREQTRQNDAFVSRLLRFVNILLMQAATSVLCNRFHL
jgi:CRP-like cAMP-binding protein